MTLWSFVLYFFALIGFIAVAAVVFRIIFDRQIAPIKEEDDEWINT